MNEIDSVNEIDSRKNDSFKGEMLMKASKGEYGYIEKKKKQVLIWTIFLFAIAISIFVIGYVTTGTKRNLFTIIAILGCLPACKSMVNLIMFFRAKGCSISSYDRIHPIAEGLSQLYDMYFTTYKVNYPICHMVLKGKVLVGFTEYKECDDDGCEKHLSQMLTQEGYKNITVKIFKDLDKYAERLNQLQDLDVEPSKNHNGILELLGQISL